MKPELHQITPFIPCTSLHQQIAFYTDVLGFRLTFEADRYAFMRRDQVAVRLIEVDSDVDLHQPERQQSIYIDVHRLQELYKSMEPRLIDLPRGRVRMPFTQSYGQREFHVADEDCTLIMFGESETTTLA